VRAALLTAPHRVELVEQCPRPIGATEVVIRVEQCGICASDVELWSGRGQEPLPAAIGHEVAGTIEEIGELVTNVSLGDRVAAWVEGGGFADAVIATCQHCVEVDPQLGYPAVAEPLACVVNAVELASPSLGDDVVIIGAGFMGNLVQVVSQLKGPRSVTVADLRSDRLRHAERLGATRTVRIATESLATTVAEVTGNSGSDLTYEVTGAQGGLDLAGEVTRMGGKLCVVGYHLGPPRMVPLGRWNWMAFEIINAHFRDIETVMKGMRAGTRLVNARRIDASQLVSHRFALEDISRAFEYAAEAPEGFVKAVVEPEARVSTSL
jgi:L-iditol 2-dehydrogenase